MTKKIITLLAVFTLVAGVVFIVKTPKQDSDTQTQLNQTASETTTKQPESMSSPKQQYSKPPELSLDTTKTYSALVSTSKGDLEINMFAATAPLTVNNFIFLARENFYDNTIFHRIIENFMIQGGDPNGDGTGGPGYKFADEPVIRDYTRGIVAMANSGPDTNGSQFFIVTRDTSLPKSYTIFGEIVGQESFATLDAIAATKVGSNAAGEKSTPLTRITIESIKISEE